jgi:5-methyltetrahydropteroyltriglutamate--homocysteine methyltransferase
MAAAEVLLPATLVGSLPKPSWLAEPNRLWAPWLLDGEKLPEAQRDAVQVALREQENAGLHVVSDGEQTRNHFVTSLLYALDGVDLARRRTVRIRDRYEASVPVVVGPVAREWPVFVDGARNFREQTSRRTKFTLPGPMTMVDTLFDEYYGSREKLAWEFARVLNEEARDLEALGIDVIQFDEPAFNVYADEVRDWGIHALMRAREGLRCKTAVHICYGYGIPANNQWKTSLGAEWRQYESIFPLLAASTLDQISVEYAKSHVPVELLQLLRGKDVLVGAVDVSNDHVETPAAVASTLRAALPHVGAEHLQACTNCGMVPLSRPAAYAKLRALAAGAAIVRRELEG